MDLTNSVETITLELQEAFGDITDSLDKLQEKLDAVEEVKGNLETYRDQVNEVLKTLVNLQAEDLDVSLDDAGHLLD